FDQGLLFGLGKLRSRLQGCRRVPATQVCFSLAHRLSPHFWLPGSTERTPATSRQRRGSFSGIFGKSAFTLYYVRQRRLVLVHPAWEMDKTAATRPFWLAGRGRGRDR